MPAFDHRIAHIPPPGGQGQGSRDAAAECVLEQSEALHQAFHDVLSTFAGTLTKWKRRNVGAVEEWKWVPAFDGVSPRRFGGQSAKPKIPRVLNTSRDVHVQRAGFVSRAGLAVAGICW